ncbi:hypothetical protein Tco_0662013 [Tanacetum coccineum]
MIEINSGSESDQEENEEEIEDVDEKRRSVYYNPCPADADDEDETKIKDKAEGDEDEGMDYTTNQFNDDVNVSLNEPVDTYKGFIQKEGTDAEMINKTEVPVTSYSHSSNLVSKFLNLLDIPHTDAKIVSPMDVLVHHEVPSNQTPTLLTVHVSVITKSSPIYTTVIPQSLPSFAPPLPQSKPTPPPITEATNPPFELLNFAFHAVLAKESSQPKLTYEATSSLTEFELKKILIDKMDESQSYMTAPRHRECYDGLIKSYDLDKSLFSTYDKVYSLKISQKDKDKDEDPSDGSNRGLKRRKTSKDVEPTKEEPEFEVADSDMPQDQDENLVKDDEEPKGKIPKHGPLKAGINDPCIFSDKQSKTFNELMSTPIDFSAYIMNGLKITNLTQETLLGPTFKLLKGTRTNYAELEYDFEECYKALLEKLD